MSDAPSARTGIVLVEPGEPEEKTLLSTAMEVWRQLNRHYPNHPWNVTFQGGALIVKHAVIDAAATAFLGRGGFGFLMPKEKVLSKRHRDLVQSAILAGGAMLELFGYRRAAWDGSEPTIPSDWKRKQQSNFG